MSLENVTLLNMTILKWVKNEYIMSICNMSIMPFLCIKYQ